MNLILQIHFPSKINLIPQGYLHVYLKCKDSFNSFEYVAKY